MSSEEYIFILTLIGLLLGFCSGLTIYFLRSKCYNVNISYGLISIQRDIENEIQEEKYEIDHNLNPFKFNETKT